MYVTAPADPIYHLAKGEYVTLCNSPILSRPDRDGAETIGGLRFRQAVSGALCSKFASFTGDNRSFSERVTDPTRSAPGSLNPDVVCR